MTDLYWSALAEETIHFLQDLIRIDTSNPPGNESLAADYIAKTLRDAGHEPTVIEMSPGRGNIISRLKGDGTDAPLLLFSHTDVVPVEREQWSVGPFCGMARGGYIYGRGALDMKGIGAMQLAVFLAIARRLSAHPGTSLKRDIILAATADEESDTDLGMGPLIAKHGDLLRAEFGISEFGGYSMYALGKCFYPIQTAEKGTVWLRMRAKGKPGHASVPHGDNAVVHLARAIDRLARAKLPVHISSTARSFISGIADGLRGAQGASIRVLLGNYDRNGSPLLEHAVRDAGLVGELRAMTHNTATPTGLKAGSKINVIPSVAEGIVDCRTVPGCGADELIVELRQALGDLTASIEFEIDSVSPPIEFTTDTSLFRTICQTLRRLDPSGYPIPSMLTGATDAKHVAKMGTICYGFSPMRFQPGERFSDMVHGHDERISIDSIGWGVRALYEVVRDFTGVV